MAEEHDDELAHFGVLGMRWGRYMNRKAAETNRRDASDLRKHGMNKEADALSALAKKQQDKADSLDAGIKGKMVARMVARERNKSVALKGRELADQLEKVRDSRDFKTKLFDSGGGLRKLKSEEKGGNETAQKGYNLHNELVNVRKGRDRTTKIIDALMTGGSHTKLFSERTPKEQRRLVAWTAALTAGAIGFAVLSNKR